ncbi:fibronectin type III domain-containing protein [Chryseobacterium echinoideorum]|uniref:fibronectin type III domain-containing protein n=1 Tax=Chryseobacterium echinoideorum TaxID=1549648 RepID=UPI001185BE5E|nr:fibronectin type III domain-containing protein [Chryseobacterium echinoideorum]
MKHYYNFFTYRKKIKSLQNSLILFVLFLIASFQFFSAQLYQVAGTCASLGTTTYALNSSTNASATNRIAVIYPASQLTGIANQQLTALYLKKYTSTDLGGTPNLKIYLKETSNLDFGAGAIDWAATTAGATLLYDSNPATATAGAAGYKSLQFSSTFMYSGTSNLMLLMEYVNTGNNTSVTWQYEYSTGCVDTGNDNTTKYINTTNGTLGSSLSSSNYRRPVIGFDYTVTCPATSVPTVSNIATNGATATWVAGGSESSWDYAVLPSSAGLPTTWTNTTATTVNLSLNPQTEYIFYVRANCGGTNGESVWKASLPFYTLCVPVATMFENFDSYATGSIVPVCWDRIITTNGSQTISSATPASGTRNIYQYSTTSQNPTAVVLPEFSNVSAGTHWLRFKARISSATGTLNVGYVTDPTNASTFTLIQALTIANTAYDSTSEYTVIIPSTVPANARLAIMNTPDGKSYYWDDVYWEAVPSCLPPVSLTSTALSSDSGSITWQASPSSPTNGYEYYYSTSNTDPTAATTPSGATVAGVNTATISNLMPNTIYYVWVRSVCSSSDRSIWRAVPSFKTLCAPVATMFENFDSYSTGSIVPDCWDRIITATGSQSISSTTPASGTRNIYQYSTTAQNPTAVVLPEFSNVSAGTHWLRFKARVSSATGTLNVGYVTDPTNASTFTLIQALTIANTAYDSTSEYTVIIPSTVPANARLAIMNTPDGKSYYWDDIYWEAVPSCFAPSSVAVSGITQNDALVSWAAPATAPANGYEIYYSSSSTPPTSSTVPSLTGITGLSANIGPLQASTNYYVWVRSVCSSSDKSNWSAEVSFTTLCGAITGAYFEDFEGYPGVSNGSTGGVLPNCWTNLGTANGGHISNSTTISGNNTLYLWTSGARIAFVALPAMSTLQSGDYRLKFDAKASVTAGGILEIGYLDTANAFVILTTFSVSAVNTTFPFSFDIPVLPAGVTQLAIKNPGTPANSLSIDNVSYELKTLSTSETVVKNTIKVYPNPFTDIVNIDKPELVNSIQIIDLSGKLVRNNMKAESVLRLNDLSQGMYILILEMKDGSRQSIKIIKK